MSENWFFLRGLVRESGHWNDFPQQFEARFPERKVILLDLPGNGLHAQDPSPATVRELAESVRADFLQSPRSDKNFVFAISLGAMVALEWLRLYPEDLQGAVLCNTSLRGLSPFYDRLRPKNYFSLLKLFLSSDLLQREKEILRMTSNQTSLHPRIAETWRDIQIAHPVSKQNAIRQLIAAARYRPSREKPTVPLLFLNSKGDQFVHPTCSEKLAKYWDAPLQQHLTAGHDLTMDDPAWVLEQLRNPFNRKS